jgi:hypothetical protein
MAVTFVTAIGTKAKQMTYIIVNMEADLFKSVWTRRARSASTLLTRANLESGGKDSKFFATSDDLPLPLMFLVLS